jgi:hypothetical protein
MTDRNSFDRRGEEDCRPVSEVDIDFYRRRYWFDALLFLWDIPFDLVGTRR